MFAATVKWNKLTVGGVLYQPFVLHTSPSGCQIITRLIPKTMKIYLLFFLPLFVTISYAQQTEVIVDASGKLILKWNSKERLSGGIALLQNNKSAQSQHKIVNDVVLLNVLTGNQKMNAKDYAGIFFNDAAGYKQGVALRRYKPWNSWTEPVQIKEPSQMPDWDVQFFYWQYNDGVYGASLPLSGNGFRTTIGSNGSSWGSKAVSYAENKDETVIPAMAVAFGKDPYELFERIYRTALQAIGKPENLRIKKKFPDLFNYIGWCTWNASDNGHNLNDELLIKAAKSFSDNRFPIGWMLIDDGWFQNTNNALQSFEPNPKQFPSGFKPVIDNLKQQYGVKYMGVWHAFNGLWNGIDPHSSLGKHYANDLFSWTQKERPDIEDAPLKTYYFIKPESDSLKAFYDNWHRYLKQQGFDFVKVDNQSVTERMAVNNYPLFTLSDSMHKALYSSVNKYFSGAIINCMDMTAEAYLNFGSSAVARCVEDYFPYSANENYNLQKGNAAAHVLQAIYNSIYFGQMVYPDFDLFQSHNPNAVFHAIARAINCGPVYITDNIGQQKFDVLRPLVYNDGRIIRSETPLLPAEDCLFQVQDKKIFKAFSMVGKAGLLGVWNVADTDMVRGIIKPSDVGNLKGEEFVMYEFFSRCLNTARRDDSFPVQLNRMGYQLFYVIPVHKGFAALGLTNKYNAPATVLNEEWKVGMVKIDLYEGGNFKAYCERAPSRITVNGKRKREYTFTNHLLTIAITEKLKPIIRIYW